MDLKELAKRYFSQMDDRISGELHVKLNKCLGELLANMPDRMAFPPERELAKVLGVNRNTLRRAMKPFVASGMLKRNNKGTFVNKNLTDPEFIPDPADTNDILEYDEHIIPHPFMNNLFGMGIHSSEVRLLLYENMPSQIRFWQKTIQDFFRKTGITVHLEQLPPSCNTDTAYREYISANKPDIFQVPELSVCISPESQAIMLPMPDVLQELIMSPQYRCNEFFSLENRTLAGSVPIYFQPYTQMINTEIAERYEIDCSGYSRGHSLDDVLEVCASNLPEDIKLSSYSNAIGFAAPQLPHVTSENIRILFNHVLRRFAKLSARGESFFLYDFHASYQWWLPAIKKAMDDNKLLHHTAVSSVINCWRRNQEQKYLVALPGWRKEAFLASTSVNMAIYRNADNLSNAVDFIRHLLSEEPQRDIGSVLAGAPMLREAASSLFDIFAIDHKAGEVALSLHREFPQDYFLAFCRHWHSQDFMRRAMNPHENIDALLDELCEDFNNFYFPANN